MSLTVNGPTGAAIVASWASALNAGTVVSAEARARASRRRGMGRVIVTSGWGTCGTRRGGCPSRLRNRVNGGQRRWVGAAASVHQVVHDVVVKRQSHQRGNQQQSDVLAIGHRALADRAAFD